MKLNPWYSSCSGTAAGNHFYLPVLTGETEEKELTFEP